MGLIEENEIEEMINPDSVAEVISKPTGTGDTLSKIQDIVKNVQQIISFISSQKQAQGQNPQQPQGQPKQVDYNKMEKPQEIQINEEKIIEFLKPNGMIKFISNDIKEKTLSELIEESKDPETQKKIITFIKGFIIEVTKW